jgi:hypothetical protein
MEKIQEKQCAICLENLKSTNLFITECNHHFCASCMIENLHESNLCPLCRKVLGRPPEKIPRLSPNLSSNFIADVFHSTSSPVKIFSHIYAKLLIYFKDKELPNPGEIPDNVLKDLIQTTQSEMSQFGFNLCDYIDLWLEYTKSCDYDETINNVEIENPTLEFDNDNLLGEEPLSPPVATILPELPMQDNFNFNFLPVSLSNNHRLSLSDLDFIPELD